MDKASIPMGITAAARADCSLWPAGAEDLSRVITGAPQSLRHKMTGYGRAVFGVDEALSVMELTGGRNIISAMAQQLGGVYVQFPQAETVEDSEDLMLALLAATGEFGDLARKAQNAVGNDGVVDVNERRLLLKSAHDLHGKVLHYLTLLDRVYGDAEVQAEVRKALVVGSSLADVEVK